MFIMKYEMSNFLGLDKVGVGFKSSMGMLRDKYRRYIPLLGDVILDIY